MFNKNSKCSGAEALLNIFKNEIDEMPDREELLTQLRTTDEFSVLGKKKSLFLKLIRLLKQSQYFQGLKGKLNSKDCAIGSCIFC